MKKEEVVKMWFPQAFRTVEDRGMGETAVEVFQMGEDLPPTFSPQTTEQWIDVLTLYRDNSIEQRHDNREDEYRQAEDQAAIDWSEELLRRLQGTAG